MRRVYMSFMLRGGWYCQFLEEDAKTPLPKTLTFASQDKVIELARRGGAFTELESRQSLNYALEIGRGGLWLNLTDEQYQRLK